MAGSRDSYWNDFSGSTTSPVRVYSRPREKFFSAGTGWRISVPTTSAPSKASKPHERRATD